MAVMLKCGAVFLHIPKTGGSWVTRVLRDQQLIHKEFSHIHADMVRVRYYSGGAQSLARSSYVWAKSLLPRRFKAHQAIQKIKKSSEQVASSRFPFTFCFVCHPLRWYESWWRYMSGRAGVDWSAESDLTSWHPCATLRDAGAADFATFVRNVNTRHPGFVTELFGLYTQHPIQFIGKQEKLADDLVRVLNLLNVRFDEQRLRESSKVNESHWERSANWTDAQWHSTCRLEFAGLVRYGYAHDDQYEWAASDRSAVEAQNPSATIVAETATTRA